MRRSKHPKTSVSLPGKSLFLYAPIVSYQMVQYALDRSWIDAPTTTTATIHISAAAAATTYVLTLSATGYV